MDLFTSDKDSDSGKEATPANRKKALTSGKIRIPDSSVLHKVVWPHKVVYTAIGKVAEYEGLTISLFISGYLVAMVAEKTSVYPLMIQHVQDWMSDVYLYGWGPVRAFHAIWLHHLEQGSVS